MAAHVSGQGGLDCARPFGGEQVNRRQLLLAGLFCAAGRIAHGQDIPGKSNADTRPVQGDEELWFLLSALDTLIFVVTGGVLKEPNEIARTIQEFQPYGVQFGELHAAETFNDALISNEGLARVADGASAIAAATQKTATMQGDLRVTVSLYPATHAGIRTKKRKGRDGRKTIAEPRRNRLDTYRRISPEDSAPRV